MRAYNQRLADVVYQLSRMARSFISRMASSSISSVEGMTYFGYGRPVGA